VHDGVEDVARLTGLEEHDIVADLGGQSGLADARHPHKHHIDPLVDQGAQGGQFSIPTHQNRRRSGGFEGVERPFEQRSELAADSE
jgi:hypothetical protein